MPEPKSWGEQYNNNFPYAPVHECPNEGCDFKEWADKLYEYLIGFQLERREPKNGLIRMGKGIFECPKCFTKFWFHLFEENIRYIIRHCPNWPK